MKVEIKNNEFVIKDTSDLLKVNNEGKLFLSGQNVTEVLNSSVVGVGVVKIVALSESEYEALSTKSSTTLYIVTPDPALQGNCIKISNASDNGTILEVGTGFAFESGNYPILLGPDGTSIGENLNWTLSSTGVSSYYSAVCFLQINNLNYVFSLENQNGGTLSELFSVGKEYTLEMYEGGSGGTIN